MKQADQMNGRMGERTVYALGECIPFRAGNGFVVVRSATLRRLAKCIINLEHISVGKVWQLPSKAKRCVCPGTAGSAAKKGDREGKQPCSGRGSGLTECQVTLSTVNNKLVLDRAGWPMSPQSSPAGIDGGLQWQELVQHPVELGGV
ncbi:uncharacterized protein LOC118456252 [Anopheles albimanus]|uniref:uncharacterized protein LOC118456252 n=1 Tax=Anopheles albimanus TaxID=7167 RepID=UPI00163F8D75|nr:uncharacterized protein LOC118456252 [Anopheles albimanus]